MRVCVCVSVCVFVCVQLIAEAAGRPNSTVLRAFDEAQARAGAAPKPRRKSRWSKYDPLADLFAPEVR